MRGVLRLQYLGVKGLRNYKQTAEGNRYPQPTANNAERYTQSIANNAARYPQSVLLINVHKLLKFTVCVERVVEFMCAEIFLIYSRFVVACKGK